MLNRILLIDDDRELCEEVEEILRSEGYKVDKSFDGFTGKKLIEKNNYDLVLLDLKMPGIDGLNLLKDIKHNNSKVKVLVLTGDIIVRKRHLGEILSEEEEKKAQSLGLADGLINKPFSIERMLEFIKRCIG